MTPPRVYLPLVGVVAVAALAVALVADMAIRGQPYGYRALVVLVLFGTVFGAAVVVAEPLLRRGQLPTEGHHLMSEPPPDLDDPEPDVCPPCGTLIRPDPPTPDGCAGWRYDCGCFGYLMPSGYQGDEVRVQVCGRKPVRRRTTAPVPAA
ncbi:hypothetical protein [Kitasatospora sp. NBC_01300]|uniref:hypothetical protein n=1 Tax=Kitasatospora sp. NBC_01300 TaxID=2903574 RepID=UPI00352E07F6|nr:hypothetical protein OG556_18280 [Kitasatospora sp. NBC_01300]